MFRWISQRNYFKLIYILIYRISYTQSFNQPVTFYYDYYELLRNARKKWHDNELSNFKSSKGSECKHKCKDGYGLHRMSPASRTCVCTKWGCVWMRNVFKLMLSKVMIWLVESVIESASIWKPFQEKQKPNVKKKPKQEGESIKLPSHGVFTYRTGRKFSSGIVIACAPVGGVTVTNVWVQMSITLCLAHLTIHIIQLIPIDTQIQILLSS